MVEGHAASKHRTQFSVIHAEAQGNTFKLDTTAVQWNVSVFKILKAID